MFAIMVHDAGWGSSGKRFTDGKLCYQQLSGTAKTTRNREICPPAYSDSEWKSRKPGDGLSVKVCGENHEKSNFTVGDFVGRSRSLIAFDVLPRLLLVAHPLAAFAKVGCCFGLI